jgi:hypothetical protein
MLRKRGRKVLATDRVGIKRPLYDLDVRWIGRRGINRLHIGMDRVEEMSKTETTVAGLPIMVSEGIPLSAVVISKIMREEDGRSIYAWVSTTDLTMVEALGMLEYAATSLKNTLLNEEEE